MNRLACLLLLLSSAAFAGDGAPAPLCPPGAPRHCVVPNWGQINPGAVEHVAAVDASPAVASVEPKANAAVRMLPVAMTTRPAAASSLIAVVSPQNLFAKETAALLDALRRARFDADGTIKTGEEAIRRAADAAVQRAGTRYALTLYVKVPQTLKPDEADLLGKKVEAINAALDGASSTGRPGTPKS